MVTIQTPHPHQASGRRYAQWAGMSLIAAVGAIHVIETPEYAAQAPYLGLLFIVNAAGATLAAVGIARGARTWGWWLGMLIAGGAFLAYVVSRTIGLPGLDEAEWLEPLGVASLVVEASFVALALATTRARRAAPARIAPVATPEATA